MQQVLDSITSQLALARGESRRLFHGRGGCFAGFESLVVDWFAPVAVIRLYDLFPDESLRSLAEFLERRPEVDCIVLQRRGVGRTLQNAVLYGELPTTLHAKELGLEYSLDVTQTKNSGLFLDMRKGREWVAARVEGKRVLNLFSYTCAFSVVAIANHAEHVVNVDMSKGVLTRGRTNHRINDLDTSKVSFLPYNIFKSWGKIGRSGPYDLVIIDPPSFQPGSFIAEKDYRRLVQRLDRLCAKGGDVLLCHNDPSHDETFLRQIMASECPTFSYVESLPEQIDFPEKLADKGVKAMVYRSNE